MLAITKRNQGKDITNEHTGSKINFNNIKYFKGNGDFRSLESIELLRQCDVVVTNPPFSLFREYIAQFGKLQLKNFLL